MDLLHQCYYSSTDDDNEEESCEQKQPEPEPVNNGIEIPTTNKKRKRNTNNNHNDEVDRQRKGVDLGGRTHPRCRIVDRKKMKTDALFSRSEPHVRGNWAGHIYIPIDIDIDIDIDTCVSSDESTTSEGDEEGETSVIDPRHLLYIAAKRKILLLEKHLNSCIIAKNVENDNDDEILLFSHIALNDSDFYNDENTNNDNNNNKNKKKKTKEKESAKNQLHVSLTRQFYLQKQSIDYFVRDIQNRLKFFESCSIEIQLSSSSSDDEVLSCDDFLVNDDRSRSFLTLSSPHGRVSTRYIQLIDTINHVMKKYNLPKFYESPQLHVSIASLKGDIHSNAELKFANMKREKNDDESDEPRQRDNDQWSEESDDETSSDIPPTITINVDKIVCSFGGGSKMHTIKLGM